MKRPQILFSALLVVLLIASCLGCASRPDEALKAAQTAMENAEHEHAADFAPGDWKSAQEVWTEAQAALAAQRYSEAAALLATSKSRFEKAGTIAKAKRDDVRQEVTLVQHTANTRLGALKQTVDAKRLSGRAQRDLAQALKDAEESIEKLNTEVLNDQLLMARTSGQTALERLNDVEKKLNSLR
jgi:hypothetical protein